MTILYSQLTTKPILLSMAAANFLLLGVCGYLFCRPAENRSPGNTGGVFYWSKDSAIDPRGAVWNGRGKEGAKAGGTYTYNPAADSRFFADSGRPSTYAEQGDTEPGEEAFSTASESLSHAAGEQASGETSASVGQPGRPWQSAGGIAAPAITSDILEKASAITPPANGATPLAFSTSDDGATPEQAAALDRLREDFITNVSGEGQNFDNAAYAKTWQEAQELSDSNYEQQFGAEAFIDAQLSQVHGGK
jgi:hypothetical protein